MKVLVVDDNRELAEVIQMVLRRAGVETLAAYDGIGGYAGYLRFKPDLVITDIQMPGGTGLEMMRHIRTHDPLVKTVYMSGSIDAYRQPLEQEKKRYPVTIFRKPFPLASLMALISEPAPRSPVADADLAYRESLPQPGVGLAPSQ